MKTLLDATLRRSPLQAAYRWKTVRQLRVLAYHGIDDPDRFARQLDYLRRTMAPVSLEDVLRALEGRSALPRRAVLLTFDDGERSLFDRGLPLLRERGLPALAFVLAGLLDTCRPYWWSEVQALVGRGGSAAAHPDLPAEQLVRALKRAGDDHRRETIAELRRTARAPAEPQPQLRRHELRELVAAGVAVGNHSLTHPCLPRCPPETSTAEVLEAHRVLSETLGEAPAAFAYPNGDWDAHAERALEEAGYQVAFLFDHRVSAWPPSHRLRVSRLRVSSHTSLDRFATILSGLHPALHHGRGGA